MLARAALLLLVAPGAVAAAGSTHGSNPDEGAPDYVTEVRPLLARRCFACHGTDEGARAAGLRLDVAEEARRDRDGWAAIVPGDHAESEVWLRVTDDVDPMPPAEAGAPLAPDELDVLRRWIDAGAPYAPHWAYAAPVRPELPAALDGADALHPIDRFVRAQLAGTGLEPSPEADRATLLRRLSYDLVGLPPTPEEVRAFLADESPGAYERQVERLLRSPHFGERWASVWLDLARYADSAGHGSDPLRTIWRYRDWVIDAYDRNLPFDRFTVEQLAGDLLPDATTRTRLATAFHRNTMTNTEGGTDDEEFRVAAVKDRVNTTFSTWMGLTVGCAECHSHKFDPVSQREYYALFDFFNHTADADRADEAPRIPTPTPDQGPEWDRLGAELTRVETELAGLGGSIDLEAYVRRLASQEDGAWSTPLPAGALGADGEALTVLGDASIRTLERRESGTRTVTLPLEPGAGAPTALRIEALPDEALPLGGPGLNSASGNFVLTDLRVRALPAEPHAVRARRVRVVLPGESRYLHLAEVQVFAEGVEVAEGRAARQSSTNFDGDAGRAVDGRTDGAYEAGSVSHTARGDDPWWEVDLGEDRAVEAVRVWNRTDGGLEQRLAGAVVELRTEDDAVVWRSAPMPPARPDLFVGPVVGEPLRPLGGTASWEQPRFELTEALDGDRDERRGWAVGGAEGVRSTAVVRLPASSGAPRALEVVLDHQWGTGHLLGRFRLGVTYRREPPPALPRAVRSVWGTPLEAWDDGATAALRALGTAEDPRRRALEAERDGLEDLRDALGVVRTPVLVELPEDERRATHVLGRGNFLDRRERVTAGVPAALHPWARPERERADTPPDRLDLARWILDDANPLTARVAVNRVWARLFGRGLVETEEDFGVQGALPTHPDLLDWLSVEHREGGWDHRALLRTIVTSATYRQASALRPMDRAHDPSGALLARYPRRRLDAEMVRDGALAAAGLLSPKKFGPSVFPPQPDGLWQAAFNGQRDWTESEGDDRWRRALYVFMRRTVPYPMLATFDAPSREVCTLRRSRTNTPLQAFVTLNDPAFHEAAQALGRVAAVRARTAGDRDAGLRLALWRTLQRPPRAEELEALGALLDDARTDFAARPADAVLFAGPAESPLGPLPRGLDAVDAAAWTLVASAALNLDAALTQR